MKRSRAILLILAAVTGLQAAPAGRPNVLFISADDMRFELGAHGAPWVKTPPHSAEKRLALRCAPTWNRRCRVARS